MTDSQITDPDWAHAWGGPLLTADFKRDPGDFFVAEIIDFKPDEKGEHDFLRVEKTNTNTAWLARQLAALAGVPVKDVGYAGLKDRRAITQQSFSVRRPGGTPVDWAAVEIEGVEIVQISRNSRKLRRGAHSGNRFEIWLRDVKGDIERLDALLSRIARHGVPNYFGEQRFGHGYANVDLARSLFGGKKLRRDKRSIAISAARSWLFNAYLARRVNDLSWNRLNAGDTAGLDGSGSVFIVEALDQELERRCESLDIHPVGPLFGRSGKPLDSDQLWLVEEFPDLASGLAEQAEMGRRSLRLTVHNLAWNVHGDDLELNFSLARGGYATSVLKEIATLNSPQLFSSNT